MVETAVLTKVVSSVMGIPAERVLAPAEPVKTQGQVAVVYLRTSIAAGVQPDGDVLTDILAGVFPTRKVGKRHGPYYLSLARTGRLETGLPEGAVPFAKRRKAAAPAVEPDAAIAAPAVEPEAEPEPEPAVVTPDPATTPIDAWSRAELQEYLRSRQLDAGGRTKELILRVRTHMGDAA